MRIKYVESSPHVDLFQVEIKFQRNTKHILLSWFDFHWIIQSHFHGARQRSEIYRFKIAHAWIMKVWIVYVYTNSIRIQLRKVLDRKNMIKCHTGNIEIFCVKYRLACENHRKLRKLSIVSVHVVMQTWVIQGYVWVVMLRHLHPHGWGSRVPESMDGTKSLDFLLGKYT